MSTTSKAVAMVLIALVFAAALPGIAYVAGLILVRGRPAPVEAAVLDPAARAHAIRACREAAPLRMRPLNPWHVSTRFLSDDPLGWEPGEYAASRIAMKHNIEQLAGGHFRWHVSNTALTIWITRHWSAEQLYATALHHGVCGRPRAGAAASLGADAYTILRQAGTC
ncbi:hypothetical protein [Lysobacter sp.]|uniref:hypothetical protein n=1 Tax=Lysobacter sp. TaxID=72226 RepID=UPI002D629D31|nr:hypothetical protein [Lysobacter sp.]HZX78175.1 hypothetical protein [Lysobacter sp.]